MTNRFAATTKLDGGSDKKKLVNIAENPLEEELVRAAVARVQAEQSGSPITAVLKQNLNPPATVQLANIGGKDANDYNWTQPKEEAKEEASGGKKNLPELPKNNSVPDAPAVNAPEEYTAERKQEVINSIVPQYKENNLVAPQWNYQPGENVINALNAYNNFTANTPEAWMGGTYGNSVNEALNKILNRDPFSYDLNGDALYQQYKDQYIRNGQLSMQDTLGKAAALTGGYGNSYATTAGAQAYNAELQKLNDRIPELYQLAYDQYQNEGNELYNQFKTLNGLYNEEYGRYMDDTNRWYTEAERLANDYNTAYKNDYNEQADKYNADYGTYSDALAQLNKDNALIYDWAQLEADNDYKKNALALDWAQLGETERHNKAAEKQNKKELQFSMDKYEAEQAEKQAANEAAAQMYGTQTKNTDNFISSFNPMSESEFMSRPTGYADYNAYLTDMVDQRISMLVNSGKLSDEEATYLMIYYGII